MAKNMIAFEKRLEIYEFLKTVCKKHDDGRAEYLPGWTDAAVAKHLSVTEGNVYSLRSSQFGITRKAPSSSSGGQREIAELIDEVSKLQQRVEHLERELGITH